MHLQPQALRLQRDRAAAAKRVKQRRRVPLGRRQDQLACCADHALIGGAVPLDQRLDELEQLLPPLLGAVHHIPVGEWRARLWKRIDLPQQLGGYSFFTRVVNQRAEDHCATSSQRLARPPQMHDRGVSSSSLSLSRFIDRVQRDRDLDQLLAPGRLGGHAPQVSPKAPQSQHGGISSTIQRCRRRLRRIDDRIAPAAPTWAITSPKGLVRSR